MNQSKRVAIYGCGGAGINLLAELMESNRTNLADFSPAFIDSSDSMSRAPAEHFYRLQNVDGAGKIRKDIANPVDRELPSILMNHPLADLNLIIFSMGGGTGSVVGPKIAAQAFQEGKAVIFFAVGSHENATTTKNNLATMRTLNGIANANDVVSVAFFDSNGNSPRSQSVDRSMVLGLQAVLDLYSGRHESLDSSDVENWVKVRQTVGIAPQLVLLDIKTNRAAVAEIPAPISVGALHAKGEDMSASIAADYGFDGYRRDENDQSLYYVIYSTGLNEMVDELTQIDKRYVTERAAREKLANSSALQSTSNDGFEY